MAIFGRKSEEEREEEERLLKEEERKDRKLTKKFKDLNPKVKKKRKEPPKPWGKLERMIVLTVLAATVIISAILALSSRGLLIPTNEKPGLPKINFDSLNIFKEETIIINKK